MKTIKRYTLCNHKKCLKQHFNSKRGIWAKLTLITKQTFNVPISSKIKT